MSGLFNTAYLCLSRYIFASSITTPKMTSCPTCVSVFSAAVISSVISEAFGAISTIVVRMNAANTRLTNMPPTTRPIPSNTRRKPGLSCVALDFALELIDATLFFKV